MARYLVINIVFMLIVGLIVAAKRNITVSYILRALLILIVMTAVFDTIIIGAGFVRYHSEHLLGIYIGKAPIEDFFYPLATVLLVPTLWNWLRRG